MNSRNFFVVFEDFSQVHRNKDVGAIPAEIRTLGFTPILVADTYKSCEFDIVRPKAWGRFPVLLGRVGSIIALRGRCNKGDVVNLYHLSAKTLIQSLAIRLLLPKGVITWVKLDMNTTKWSLHVAALIGGEVRARNLNDLAIKFAGRLLCATTNVVSAESSICYRYISRWPIRRAAHFPNGVFRHEFINTIHKRENIICCIARHGDPNKRSENLLTAFCELDLHDWKLDLIGPFTDEFRSRYENIVRTNPIMASRINLAGNLTDRKMVLMRLARSRVFALLSMYEGFSLALLEAAASGCFCIATDVGGAADVLKEGGILLPPNFSTEQLRKALQQATEKENFNNLTMSTKTIARFDWEKLLQDFVPNLNDSNL